MGWSQMSSKDSLNLTQRSFQLYSEASWTWSHRHQSVFENSTGFWVQVKIVSIGSSENREYFRNSLDVNLKFAGWNIFLKQSSICLNMVKKPLCIIEFFWAKSEWPLDFLQPNISAESYYESGLIFLCFTSEDM